MHTVTHTAHHLISRLFFNAGWPGWKSNNLKQCPTTTSRIPSKRVEVLHLVTQMLAAGELTEEHGFYKQSNKISYFAGEHHDKILLVAEWYISISI